jgi:hypothetical protein
MRFILAAAVCVCTWATIPLPPVIAGNTKPSAAKWLLQEARNNRIADFNERCGELDPTKDDHRWSDPCRVIHPAELIALVLQNDVPRSMIRLIGADIDGDIDLQNVGFAHEIWIARSRIEGALDLSAAQLSGRLILEGTKLAGLYGNDLRSSQSLLLRNATFTGDVFLQDAKIGGNIELSGSILEKKLQADRLQVSGSLFLQNTSFQGKVVLVSAKIERDIEMGETIFNQDFKAYSLQILGSLLIREKTIFKGAAILNGTRIFKDFSGQHSVFEKNLDADHLQVAGVFLVRNSKVMGEFNH